MSKPHNPGLEDPVNQPYKPDSQVLYYMTLMDSISLEIIKNLALSVIRKNNISMIY